jgi:ATP-binding cassette subfamily B protein
MKTGKTPAFKRIQKVFRLAWSLSRSYVIANLIYGLTLSLFPYVAIYFGALIIDSIIAGNSVNATMNLVYWLISIDLVIGLLNVFLKFFVGARENEIQTLVNRKIAVKNYDLAYNQVEDEVTMRLVSLANEGSNGSGGMTSFVTNLRNIVKGFSDIIYALLLLGGLFALATPNKIDQFSSFLADPWSALIVFVPVVISVIIGIAATALVNKTAYKAMMQNVESNRRYQYFWDLCVNYKYGKDIRLYSMQRMILAEQGSSKYSVNTVWDRFSKLDALFEIMAGFLVAVVTLVAYSFMGLKALYGLISIGSALAYVGALTILTTAISTLASSAVGLGLNSDYLQNYFDDLALPSALVYGPEKLDEKIPLSIEFQHVTFTYPKQKDKVLDDVSLAIKPNEKLAIVGVNGAGKTTLMKLLCRFYEPDSGTILVNGKPLPSYDEASAYRLYAIVFQDFKLFSFSVLDNVASGPNGDEAKAIDCLKKVGIYDRIQKFPEGIHTTLYNENDKNGVEISGGEAQKIAIARALYKDSPLVILDEPTSALDPKSEAEIYEDLGELAKGKTAVFISHRMSSTKFCDDIAVIDKGKIVEEGTHNDLMAIENGLYKKMWEAQAQYYN